MVEAGKFRDRARFERQAVGDADADGNPVADAWDHVCTLWGDLRETPGREVIAAGGQEASATGTLRLRASTQSRAITAADRVQIRGAYWSIVGLPTQVDARGTVIEFRLSKGGAM